MAIHYFCCKRKIKVVHISRLETCVKYIDTVRLIVAETTYLKTTYYSIAQSILILRSSAFVNGNIYW